MGTFSAQLITMAFTVSVVSYISALVIDVILLFFASIHLITFDELRTEHKNPVDQCASLNPLVLPEYCLHFMLSACFLCAGEWFSFIINTPLIIYHSYRYSKRPVMSGHGLYDPTTILNMEVVTRCQREGWIKLAFYIISFFYYLYGLIYSLIASF